MSAPASPAGDARAPRVLVAGAVLGQPMGGVRRHNAELLPRAARLLAAAGGGLAVLEGRAPVAFPLPPEAERLPSDVPAGPPLARARREGRALRACLARAAAAGAPFDLVHTGHLPAPRLSATPLALVLHDLRALDPSVAPERRTLAALGRRLVAARVVRAAVARAARVIVVSETVRAELVRRFGLAAGRIDLVPNAADHLPLFPRAPAAEPFLLHVGHVEPRKNLELLVRALALDPTLPPAVLAGAAKRDEDERLRRLARRLGALERLRFAGPVPDEELARLYARAACVVLPSRLEGFGIPALEARRAGAPLAVAHAGALPEVAGPETPLFPPDDPRALAAAVHAALRRPPAALAAAAARAAEATWDASAERLVAAWRRAAAAPAAHGGERSAQSGA